MEVDKWRSAWTRGGNGGDGLDEEIRRGGGTEEIRPWVVHMARMKRPDHGDCCGLFLGEEDRN